MKIKFSNILIVIGVALVLFMAFGLISSISNNDDITTNPSITDSVVTEPESVNIIEFTISIFDNSYTLNAEEGMTWGEWVDSEYNTVGITNGNSDGENVGSIYYEVSFVFFDYYPLCSVDVISSGAHYEVR